MKKRLIALIAILALSFPLVAYAAPTAWNTVDTGDNPDTLVYNPTGYYCGLAGQRVEVRYIQNPDLFQDVTGALTIYTVNVNGVARSAYWPNGTNLGTWKYYLIPYGNTTYVSANPSYTSTSAGLGSTLQIRCR